MEYIESYQGAIDYGLKKLEISRKIDWRYDEILSEKFSFWLFMLIYFI